MGYLCLVTTRNNGLDSPPAARRHQAKSPARTIAHTSLPYPKVFYAARTLMREEKSKESADYMSVGI